MLFCCVAFFSWQWHFKHNFNYLNYFYYARIKKFAAALRIRFYGMSSSHDALELTKPVPDYPEGNGGTCPGPSFKI